MDDKCLALRIDSAGMLEHLEWAEVLGELFQMFEYKFVHRLYTHKGMDHISMNPEKEKIG